MSRTARRTVVAVAIVLAGLAPVWARGGRGRPAAHDDGPPVLRDSGPYVGGRVGWLEVEGVDDGSLNLGLVFGYRWAGAFGLEGSVDYHEPDFDLYGRSTWAFQASAVLHPFPPRAPVQPFVLAGVGYYASRYDVGFDHDGGYALDDDAGFHAGVGADVPLFRDPATGGRTQFTVDARWLFTREDEPWERRRRDGVLVAVGLKIRF